MKFCDFSIFVYLHNCGYTFFMSAYAFLTLKSSIFKIFCAWWGCLVDKRFYILGFTPRGGGCLEQITPEGAGGAAHLFAVPALGVQLLHPLPVPVRAACAGCGPLGLGAAAAVSLGTCAHSVRLPAPMPPCGGGVCRNVEQIGRRSCRGERRRLNSLCMPCVHNGY